MTAQRSKMSFQGGNTHHAVASGDIDWGQWLTTEAAASRYDDFLAAQKERDGTRAQFDHLFHNLGIQLFVFNASNGIPLLSRCLRPCPWRALWSYGFDVGVEGE
jgi:hypothetical protein